MSRCKRDRNPPSALQNLIFFLSRDAKMTVGPGDCLKLNVKIDDKLTIEDNVIITFFDEVTNIMYTCGHCFPKNAQLKNGQGTLIYSSGFDDADSDIEIARVRIWNSFGFTNSIPSPQRGLTFVKAAVHNLASSIGFVTLAYLTKGS